MTLAPGMDEGNSTLEDRIYIEIFGGDGPQSRSASSPATGIAEETVAITREAVRDLSDQEWVISIFREDGQQPDPEARSEHRIPKVPAKFRKYEKDKKYFDPRVVSLGPYHHGKDHLKPMEKHKIRAVKQFVDESSGKIFYEKVKELTGVLKEFYDAEVVGKMRDYVFARMMFLDSCFVLHFIDKISERAETKLKISTGLIPLIIRDMFLIENQLPFEVLDVLMNLRWGSSSTGKENILKFIKSKVLMPMGMFFPVHSQPCRALDGGEHDRPLHLLDILRTILLDFPPSKWTEKKSYGPHNFDSVMELKKFGIRFEKRRMKSLMGIRYKENLLFPRLLLPTMYISDTTISRLLNLTAFEACSDTYSGCGVTSYIHFMDSIIKDGADVKELRSKGILHHSLGSDDELARLFKKWPVDVKNNLKLYIDISTQIFKHRNRKVNIPKWIEKYFGRTWIVMSVLSGSILLVLAAIQTYFTVFPRR